MSALVDRLDRAPHDHSSVDAFLERDPTAEGGTRFRRVRVAIEARCPAAEAPICLRNTVGVDFIGVRQPARARVWGGEPGAALERPGTDGSITARGRPHPSPSISDVAPAQTAISARIDRRVAPLGWYFSSRCSYTRSAWRGRRPRARAQHRNVECCAYEGGTHAHDLDGAVAISTGPKGPTTSEGVQLALEVSSSPVLAEDAKTRLLAEIMNHESTHGRCTRTFIKKIRKQTRLGR